MPFILPSLTSTVLFLQKTFLNVYELFGSEPLLLFLLITLARYHTFLGLHLSLSQLCPQVSAAKWMFPLDGGPGKDTPDWRLNPIKCSQLECIASWIPQTGVLSA